MPLPLHDRGGESVRGFSCPPPWMPSKRGGGWVGDVFWWVFIVMVRVEGEESISHPTHALTHTSTDYTETHII